MGWDRLQWHQIGKARLRAKEVGGRHEYPGAVESDPAPMPATHKWLAAGCDGSLVARSRILVSDSTATLVGTLTNETSCYVYFSGMPPYASTLDSDGSETVLLGDFNFAPREQPSCGDCVMHPGASVPYRSIPVTLRNPRPRWDGTDWCVSSHSMTLDRTFYNQGEVLSLQLFDQDDPARRGGWPRFRAGPEIGWTRGRE